MSERFAMFTRTPSFFRRLVRRCATGCCAVLGAAAVSAAGLSLLSSEAAADTIPLERQVEVRVLQRELGRTMSQLRLPNREPPYYGAYWLVDYDQNYVSASLGDVVEQNTDAGRRLRVELRVGSPKLDNSNFAGVEGMAMRVTDGLIPVPYGATALERTLWVTSDNAYRRAVELLDQKRAQRSAQVELESLPDDFSTQGLVAVEGPEALPLPAPERLAALAQQASAVFKEYPGVHESAVSIEARSVTRTLVNSRELTSRESQRIIEVVIQCHTQASDGMPLSHQLTLFDELRPEVLKAESHRLARELSELREAALVSDYFGPVLFEGRAGAQIVNELLADPLSATPRGEQGDSPLSRRLGKRILPPEFSVYDDPSIDTVFALPLVGGYLMDDEGVSSQRVSLVEGGRLRGMLTSRTPSRDFAASNGHGRSGLSGWARGMVGNLVVEARRGASTATLRRKLLEAVKAEGGEYGLIVQRLSERAYSTGGAAPPEPERVFKLKQDGSLELVRGARLSEMNLRDLRMVLAHGAKPEVYSYQVRWPSGLSSPTSVVAPSLLFEEVELTKPKRSYQRPKVLARPPP